MKTRRAPELEFRPSDFFVLRTPTLPFDLFERWSDGIEVPWRASDDPALDPTTQSDRLRLRSGLREAIAMPEFRAALRVAAPDLEAQLPAWEHAPDGPRGARVELALVRYFTRMTTRPTPFGLFAGNTVGRLGSATRLSVGPRTELRPRTRLDMDYLDAIARSLGRDAGLRSRLPYRPNETLYRAGGRLRYVEVRGQGSSRTHHLVAAEPSEHLLATLARARGGATLAELAPPLAREHGVALEEAEAFVGQLIDRQLLVSELMPVVTSTDAVGELEDLLRAHGGEDRTPAQLALLRRRLAAQDALGIAGGSEAHREIVAAIPTLPEKPDLPYALQVDVMRPGSGAMLGPDLIEELIQAARLLHALTPVETRELDHFREAFLERYETQAVPLTEALDPEIGIGFGGTDPRAEAAPWLEGLAFPEAGDVTQRRTATLHALLSKAWAPAADELEPLELTDEDVRALEDARRPPLPDAFAVMATVASASESALAAGDFQIVVDLVLGPSGARLMGRFCHVDPELRAAVEGHLREEEALRPEAVFAEIVHLPEGRLGNVICRPPLRTYELPFLGRSGAAPERQIPLSDLRVSVEQGRIVLRSERLGREVVPRLTSAHNYRWRSLALYRFLCSLQGQGVSERAFWSWGSLETAPYLPRLTHGRIVIARARWRVLREELNAFAELSEGARIRALRAWRLARRLPRKVFVTEADHRLLVDFENVLGVASFLHVARSRSETTLTECFPGPDALVARGADGRYTHEILVPFVRTAPLDGRPGATAEDTASGAAQRSPLLPTPAAERRVFPPGSEWLFAKLYTGPATADHVLRRVVKPLVESLLRQRTRPWFFLRYGDPSWHLRVRVSGEPSWLREVVAPELERLLAPLLEEGSVWRLAYDTYRREIERYGGPKAIPASEQLFDCDSRCALDLIEMLGGDTGLEARTELALVGADHWFDAFGFDSAARRAIVGNQREGLALRLGVDRDFEHQLDAAFRKRRPRLEPLVESRDSGDARLGPALKRLERRSADVRPIVAELREQARANGLTATLGAIAAAHVHLQCNRLLRAAHAEQELVIHDTLCRLYDSREARRRARGA